MAVGVGKVTAIMCDTVDLEKSVGFWSELLGLEELGRTDTYVYLSKVGEDGPHLAFQLVEEPRPGKNRLHLDIAVDSRAEFEEAIVARGGSVIGVVDEPGFPVWTTMADPLGNEFCIYEPTRPDDPPVDDL